MGPGHSYTKYGLVKIEDLNKAEEGTVVTQESLEAAGIVTKNKLKLTKVRFKRPGRARSRDFN